MARTSQTLGLATKVSLDFRNSQSRLEDRSISSLKTFLIHFGSTAEQPNMNADRQSIERDIDDSAWLAANTREPLIGNSDCPSLADDLGPRGMPLYYVFVEERPDHTFGCCRDACNAFNTPSLEAAIRHQRYHHFNHSPFVCLPANGTPWFVSNFTLLSSFHHPASSRKLIQLLFNSGRRFYGELDLMNHQVSTGH